jgi:hypothetical protein
MVVAQIIAGRKGLRIHSDAASNPTMKRIERTDRVRSCGVGFARIMRVAPGKKFGGRLGPLSKTVKGEPREGDAQKRSNAAQGLS